MVNVVTNKVSRLLGKDETVRWMNLSLYQGAPAKRGFTTVVCRPFLYRKLALAYFLTLGHGRFGQPYSRQKRSKRPDSLLHRV